MARTAKTASSAAKGQAASAQGKQTNAAKLAAFDEAIKLANSKIESETGRVIAKMGEGLSVPVETISAGSVVFDSISGGGFPRGRVIEIYGEESSGKTSLALTAVGNMQKNGGTAAFIDLENALDPVYASKLGVDIEALALSQPDYAEQALNLVHFLAQTGVVDIIVVDSVAALVPEAALNSDLEQQTIGLLARLMSKSLPRLVKHANRTGTTVIFINQTRDAIGTFSPMGTPKTTPGGKALKFFASQRVEIKRLEQVKEGSDVIGNKVRMRIVKNKIAPPFGKGETVLTFGRGINRAAELVEVGPDHGVIHKPNNRTYVDAKTGETLGTSKANAIAFLEEHDDIRVRMQQELQEAIRNDIYGVSNADKNQNDPANAAATENGSGEGEDDLLFKTSTAASDDAGDVETDAVGEETD